MQTYILVQVLPLADTPSDLSSFLLKSDEVKILRPKYDLQIGQFLGIIKWIGQMVVRGDQEQIFLEYGYDAKKSKLLYSTNRARIPKSF